MSLRGRTGSPEWVMAYHFGLRVVGGVVVAPGVGRGVAGSHLVDGPAALAHPVAAHEVVIFYDVQYAHAQPAPAVTWLLLDRHRHARVGLGQWVLKQHNRVGTCAFAAVSGLPVLADFNAGGLVGLAELGGFFWAGVAA